MFTRMQKYHKIFLVFVTALIAASFGLGGLIDRLLDPENLEVMGTFQGEGKISKSLFHKAVRDWTVFWRFATYLSPKAKKIQIVKQGESPQQYAYLLYMPNSVWDSIFSLREDVSKLDQELDEQLSHPYKWTSILKGDFDFLGINHLQAYPPRWEELEFYKRLPDKKREKLFQPPSKTDIWNMLMILHQANQWGIKVTEEEVAQFVALSQKQMGGADEFNQRLKNLNMFPADFEKTAKEALTILKYLEMKNGNVKIPVQSAYDSYRRLYTKYRLQWLKIGAKAYDPKDEKGYLEQRLAFYDQKQKVQADYFKLPAVSDFEYLLVKTSDFVNQVTVTPEELEKAFQDKQKSKKNEMEDLLDELEKGEKKEKESREKVENDLKLSKATQKASQWMSEIRAKIAPLTISMPLAQIASHYNLTHVMRKDVSEEMFPKEEIYTDKSRENIYGLLRPGKLSPVMNLGEGSEKKFFVVRLLKHHPARQLSREEIEKNDSLFLERYYHHHRESFKVQERYRIGYVIADYGAISKNLLVTTQVMQDFYQKYKEELYKIEGQEKDKAEYRSFEEVKRDLEPRAINFLKIKELQQIHIVHGICQKQGKESNLRAISEEMARQIMSARDGMVYHEDPQLLTRDEIRQNNPTGDDEFPPSSLNTEGEISEVKDSPKGKYFYKVVAYEPSAEPSFEKIYDRVKEHFMKSQIAEKAKEELKGIKEAYDRRCKEILMPAEKDKERQIRSRIFNLLAMERNLSAMETPLFQKIDEVKELKNVPQIEMVLSMQEGEIGEPLSDEKNDHVFLMRMVHRDMPEIAEIPTSKIERIRKILWHRAYRSRWMSYLDHNTLKKEMNLQIKSEEGFDDEEGQERYY